MSSFVVVVVVPASVAAAVWLPTVCCCFVVPIPQVAIDNLAMRYCFLFVKKSQNQSLVKHLKKNEIQMTDGLNI